MKRLIAIAIVGALALAACAGNDASPEGVSEVTYGDSGGESGAPPEDGEGRLEVDVAIDDGREVIRRASLQLHATNTRAAFDEVLAIASGLGGFASNAVVHPASDDDQPAVTMTIRVPADSLDAALTAIKDTADEVVSETRGAEDVTEQFVDLEARLTNLQALEVELRALLQEVRMRETADPDEILRVFNEVSSVRSQIEQLQGQMNYLGDLTALATIEIGITQTPSSAPIVDQPWSPATVARESLSRLVVGLQSVADWAIGFAIYALPMMLIVLGPVVLIGAFAYRKWLRRPPAPPTPAES